MVEVVFATPPFWFASATTSAPRGAAATRRRREADAADVRCAVTAMGAGFRDTFDESFSRKVRGDADAAPGADGAGLAERGAPHRCRRGDVDDGQPGRRRRHG